MMLLPQLRPDLEGCIVIPADASSPRESPMPSPSTPRLRQNTARIGVGARNRRQIPAVSKRRSSACSWSCLALVSKDRVGELCFVRKWRRGCLVAWRGLVFHILPRTVEMLVVRMQRCQTRLRTTTTVGSPWVNPLPH